MSVVAPWFKTSSEELERLIRSGAGPLWRRVADLGACRAQANGHATFGRGMLARIFDEDRRTIARAIRTAIEYGYLHESSCSQCLVPPLWLYENSFGNGRKPCEVNHPERSRTVAEERSEREATRISPDQRNEERQLFPQTSSVIEDKRLHSLSPKAGCSDQNIDLEKAECMTPGCGLPVWSGGICGMCLGKQAVKKTHSTANRPGQNSNKGESRPRELCLPKPARRDTPQAKYLGLDRLVQQRLSDFFKGDSLSF